MTGTGGYPAVAALALTVFVFGCDSRSPSAPFPSQTPPPSAPPPPYVAVGGTLFGVVFEMKASERVPVVGVEVYCDACGPFGHSATFTDGNGYYSLAGAPAGRTRVLLSKSGFTLPRPDWVGPGGIGWMGGIDAIVNGDTQFDIEVARQ